MKLLGLTGGIGSGKSTVSALLAERGAVVVDADKIAREVVEPGGRAYDALVARFGEEILLADRTVDRPKLAAVVFADEEARRDLNRITHPAVGAVMAEQIAAERETDHVVILDIPLLAEGGGRNRWGASAIIVVDCPLEVALERLVEQRGMDPADAQARMAAQATREQRIALADRVIDNSGDLEALRSQVDETWAWIDGLPETAAAPAR